MSHIELTTNSNPNIDTVFSTYQAVVDSNIYEQMCVVDAEYIKQIYDNRNSAMYYKAIECINPCMAFATCWGEAGCSQAGVSLTQVMDFSNNTYLSPIDWISVTSNLEQVDENWYYANTRNGMNINTSSRANGIPVNLLQYSSSTTRELHEYNGLGVGPYQVTTSDWNTWNIGMRVSPIEGWKASLRRAGTLYLDCGINPISDMTVYACLSLSHQGSSLITYDFGIKLINKINDPYIQSIIDKAGYEMYLEMKEKATTGNVDLSSVDISKYVNYVQDTTGVDFSQYTGGPGRTNKGMYVLRHCVQYAFYKYYINGGA